jgi:hypothetical protein
MSRFGYDGDGDGIPQGLWDATLSRALGGRRGQEALADMETALLKLPEPRLIEGHLALGGATCAVGALVAHKRATTEGVDIAAVIEAMSARVQCWCGHSRDQHHGGACTGRLWQDRPCSCTAFDAEEIEDVFETVAAGERVGLMFTVAWHLAHLNDETFGGSTPEERHRLMLAWVRRAQGKPVDDERIGTATSGGNDG